MIGLRKLVLYLVTAFSFFSFSNISKARVEDKAFSSISRLFYVSPEKHHATEDMAWLLQPSRHDEGATATMVNLGN